MKPIVVAITGASGVIYGVRAVKYLLESGHSVYAVISDAARLVIEEELHISVQDQNREKSITALFGDSVEKLTLFSPKDFKAPIASGSFPIEGMIIAPCSMGTLGAIASGVSNNLIHRAADCVLKEKRKLVIVPRETPLNAIHLENMLKLSRLGVSVVPAMPGFYSGEQTLDEIIDFMVGKIFDQLDIAHALYPRWTGSPKGNKVLWPRK